MRRLLLFLAITLVAGAPARAQVAIVDVTVIDVTGGPHRAHQTVLLDGDRITAIGPTEALRLPRTTRSVDGRGKFLIPGLWDMHVHLGIAGRSAIPLLLATGVTSVRDMGGDPVVLRWRDSITAGTMVGPRIKAAGLIVENARWRTAVMAYMKAQGTTTMLPELERRLGVATAADAERAIDSLVRLGADFVKVRTAPPPAAFFALAAAARRHGLGIAGHAPPFAQLASASDSGFRSLEHPVLDAGGRGLVEAFMRLDGGVRAALLQRLARNATAWTPTFVTGNERLLSDSARRRLVNDSIGVSDVAYRDLPAPMRAAWRVELERGLRDPDTLTDWRAIHAASLKLAREALDAGVPIMAGTDTPVLPLVPGYSLHDELALLVRDAGLTPREALRAATATPAAYMGLGASLGQLLPGMLGDLVLLDADPTLDITATRRVRAVVSRGVVYDRGALDRLLAPRVASPDAPARR